MFSAPTWPATSQSSTPTSLTFSSPMDDTGTASPTFPTALRPHDLAGLGFSINETSASEYAMPTLSVTHPTQFEHQQPNSPLSPPSPASPSPGSPLLGAESHSAVRFNVHDIPEDNEFQDELRQPSPAGFKPLWLVSNHTRTASSVGKHRHRRSNSRKLSRRFSISSLHRKESPSSVLDAEQVLPAKSLLFLGFLLGPWCWLIGGFYLRQDGQLFGVRKEICKCKAGSLETCPVQAHRSLRLIGMQMSGHGLGKDAAFYDMGLDYQTDGFVKWNRGLAIGSSIAVSTGFGLALWMVVLHW